MNSEPDQAIRARIAELERTITHLELAQRRMMVLLRPGEDTEKAFMRAVLAAGLDERQEIDVLNVIRSFVVDSSQRDAVLGRIRTEDIRRAATASPSTLTALVETVHRVVGDVWVAESLVKALRTQEPHHKKWSILDPEDAMADWPQV